MRRITGFVRRLWRGEDVILVQQNKERWDEQFEHGCWYHLLSGHPNTIFLSGVILDQARQNGKRLRVLDVGCGNGALAVLLNGAHDEVEYHGLDVSEKALTQARSLAPDSSFSAGDAEHPSTDLGVFDAIVFSEFLYYIDPSVIALYRLHAHRDTIIFISAIHSWRSVFVWKRIRHEVKIVRNFTISDRNANQRFDIALARFKTAPPLP